MAAPTAKPDVSAEVRILLELARLDAYRWERDARRKDRPPLELLTLADIEALVARGIAGEIEDAVKDPERWAIRAQATIVGWRLFALYGAKGMQAAFDAVCGDAAGAGFIDAIDNARDNVGDGTGCWIPDCGWTLRPKGPPR